MSDEKHMRKQNHSTAAVLEQAAHWTSRVHEGELSDEERAELHGWLLEDDTHQREFLAHSSVIAIAEDLSTDARTELIECIDRQQRIRRTRWLWFTPIAACLLIAITGFIVWSSGHQTYATVAGETRTVEFPEGSIAYLNTRTQLRWTGTAKEGRVVLLKGEALFDVRPQKAAPFNVVVDDSEIRVLGTRFNVYRRATGETTVTVLEGTVEVFAEYEQGRAPAWTRLLHTNEQLSYGPSGILKEVHKGRAATAVDWRQGVIELEDWPLSDVLEELSRYSDRPIVLTDARLARAKVTGAIGTTDVRASLGLLAKLLPITIKEDVTQITVEHSGQRRR